MTNDKSARAIVTILGVSSDKDLLWYPFARNKHMIVYMVAEFFIKLGTLVWLYVIENYKYTTFLQSSLNY
jgi:hypothetical protein